jgi:hypothetical protein
MSKKTDNLKRIIQDLEARYGKDDPDIMHLNVALSTLKSNEVAPRRRWMASQSRHVRLRFADVDNRALNT